MKYLIRLSLPVGLILWLAYTIINRISPIKDSIAMPMLIVSIILMMIGIAYHGWCFGRGKSPYDWKGSKGKEKEHK
jgi:hypothetical protein